MKKFRQKIDKGGHNVKVGLGVRHKFSWGVGGFFSSFTSIFNPPDYESGSLYLVCPFLLGTPSSLI